MTVVMRQMYTPRSAHPREWDGVVPMSSASERETAAARLSAFAVAMAAARAAAKMSQRELGHAIQRPQGSVSRYESGLIEPPAPTVFAMEQALDLEPGELSHYLGYMPIVESRIRHIMPVLDALEQDPRLNPQAKTMLINVYRQMARVSNRIWAKAGEEDEEGEATRRYALVVQRPNPSPLPRPQWTRTIVHRHDGDRSQAPAERGPR